MLKPKGGCLLGTRVLTSLKVSHVNPLFFTKGDGGVPEA